MSDAMITLNSRYVNGSVLLAGASGLCIPRDSSRRTTGWTNTYRKCTQSFLRSRSLNIGNLVLFFDRTSRFVADVYLPALGSAGSGIGRKEEDCYPKIDRCRNQYPFSDDLRLEGPSSQG